MTLAIFKSYDLAAAAQDLAWRYVQETQGARGSAWADILTDGKQFGFFYDATVAPAFLTPPVLLEIEDTSIWSNATLPTPSSDASTGQLL